MAAGASTVTDVNIYEDEEEKDFKQIYKILIIGDSNVGKTALLTRFVEGRFQSAFMSTVGEYVYNSGCVLKGAFGIILVCTPKMRSPAESACSHNDNMSHEHKNLLHIKFCYNYAYYCLVLQYFSVYMYMYTIFP